jgi:hypothetical protein
LRAKTGSLASSGKIRTRRATWARYCAVLMKGPSPAAL